MNDEMREAFSEWAGDTSSLYHNHLAIDETGKWYTDNATQHAWAGFQVAYQLQQKKIEKLAQTLLKVGDAMDNFETAMDVAFTTEES